MGDYSIITYLSIYFVYEWAAIKTKKNKNNTEENLKNLTVI